MGFKVLRFAGTFVGFFSFLIHTSVRGKTISPCQGFTSLALFGTLRAGLMIWPQVHPTAVLTLGQRVRSYVCISVETFVLGACNAFFHSILVACLRHTFSVPLCLLRW